MPYIIRKGREVVGSRSGVSTTCGIMAYAVKFHSRDDADRMAAILCFEDYRIEEVSGE